MAADTQGSTNRRISPKRTPTVKQQQARYDRYNREWAEKILRDPEALPYMASIARNVLERLEESKRVDRNRPRL